jgi:hypothetical protein
VSVKRHAFIRVIRLTLPRTCASARRAPAD